MSEPFAVSLDDRIGLNVTVARVDRHMSQGALGEAMRRAGWKWTQATVWSVESGRRPLRLSESTTLTGILGIGIGDLLLEPRSTERPQPARGSSTHLARIRELEAELDATRNRL